MGSVDHADLDRLNNEVSRKIGVLHARVDEFGEKVTGAIPLIEANAERSKKTAEDVSSLATSAAVLAEQVKNVTSAVEKGAVEQERRHEEVIKAVAGLKATTATKEGDGEADALAWVRTNPVVALGALVTSAMVFLLTLSFMADIMRGTNDTEALLQRLDKLEDGASDAGEPADE